MYSTDAGIVNDFSCHYPFLVRQENEEGNEEQGDDGDDDDDDDDDSEDDEVALGMLGR